LSTINIRGKEYNATYVMGCGGLSHDLNSSYLEMLRRTLEMIIEVATTARVFELFVLLVMMKSYHDSSLKNLTVPQ
jgi:hypothetical protein